MQHSVYTRRCLRLLLLFLLLDVVIVCVWKCLAAIHRHEGDLSFASYYGDHMVLQKSPERAVLWGYGSDGAQVTLTLSGPTKQKTSPVTVTNGIWRVTLNPVKAGGPYNVTAVTKDSNATLTDVLFGDIWLCGGQSNMWFNMSMVRNASKELKLSENYTDVRFFMASLRTGKTEQLNLTAVEIPWSVAPTNLAGFSAVCWLYGRYLYDTLQYPIGLVESCWGGTPVEVWSSSRALQRCGQDYTCPKNDSVLWNSMIHPLLNMTIKGAIWYQGEANTYHNEDKYACTFPAMIDDWRMSFHKGSGGQTAKDFPFGFVQLSTDIKTCASKFFPNVRWHQTADFGYVPNERMANTFMAVALDLPDPDSPLGPIHPRDKQDVAYRLTLGARAVAYNEKGVAFQGPFPKLILDNGTHVIVNYDQKISVKKSDRIFEICCTQTPVSCGNESPWVAAPIVWSNKTSVKLSTHCEPSQKVGAVRYAWRDWPCDFKACPIYSANKTLPAPPFFYPMNRQAVNTAYNS
ncbi:sialate O-acetylesterase-like isoform X2 [Epinephelus fuscoguttatus]|uniref:sialate O-acetylesterase-like isoform X2 n=1 Tax=Epinephelus fuscoguttatus TaxID=293821 RepID=UPI0020D0CC4A|nr:sialate O-acetylesterase-like isoform X2 [Epinephelus fuscoguttatus]